MDSHYDEFGNYIGPELSDDSDSDGGADANDQQVRSHHRRIPQDTLPPSRSSKSANRISDLRIVPAANLAPLPFDPRSETGRPVE